MEWYLSYYYYINVIIDDDDDDDEAFLHHHPADSMPTLTTNPLIPLGAATDDSGRR
jgi:hypothetical protein